MSHYLARVAQRQLRTLAVKAERQAVHHVHIRESERLQLRQRIGEGGVVVGAAHAVEGAVRRQAHTDARGRKDGRNGGENLRGRKSRKRKIGKWANDEKMRESTKLGDSKSEMERRKRTDKKGVK